MSRIKLLLDVVGDLRSLADSLQVVADAMLQSEAVEVPAAGKKQELEKVDTKKAEKKQETSSTSVSGKKPLTLEGVRAVLAEKSRSGHTEEVRELLSKHGADKLSEIDPAEYPALLAEAEVL